MAENHMIKQSVGLFLAVICLSTVSNVCAQAVQCNINSITIKDPLARTAQCQDCLKCPAGQGLSVKCGDVIPLSKPLVCKPCVLGETYSSAYEAGACKDCKNCGQYRETKKACTLTSSAECGKCKLGAYEEFMLGMCKPCSPCCNDENDIVVPECLVPGVPKNMQCSFARSEKCGKVIANTSASTIASPLQTTEPMTIPPELVTIPLAATVPAHLEPTGKQLASPANSPSPNWAVIGSVIGVVGFVLIPVLVSLVRYCKVKRKDVNTDIEMQQVPGNDDANECDGSEIDEPNPESALLDTTQVPLGVEETLDSPLPTGTQDTQPPGPHRSTGFKAAEDPPPEPSCGSHSHAKIQKTTVKETTVCITCTPV